MGDKRKSAASASGHCQAVGIFQQCSNTTQHSARTNILAPKGNRYSLRAPLHFHVGLHCLNNITAVNTLKCQGERRSGTAPLFSLRQICHSTTTSACKIPWKRTFRTFRKPNLQLDSRIIKSPENTSITCAAVCMLFCE